MDPDLLLDYDNSWPSWSFFLIKLIKVVVITVNFRHTLLTVFGIRCGMQSVVLYFSALQVFFLELRCMFMWIDVVYVTPCNIRRFSEVNHPKCLHNTRFLQRNASKLPTSYRRIHNQEGQPPRLPAQYMFSSTQCFEIADVHTV